MTQQPATGVSPAISPDPREPLPMLHRELGTGAEGLRRRHPSPNWGYLGVVSAGLAMSAFFYVLWRAGWQPGDPTGPDSALHDTYVTATTATFAGIVTCQIGTAFAARTDHASLREIGLWTNPLLLAGIAFELVFTAALIYFPPVQGLFGTRRCHLM